MTTLETYLERASDCRREAEQTILPNVREQCLRAAFAWELMAQRLQLAEKFRAEEAERKARMAHRLHLVERYRAEEAARKTSKSR
jgi:hypothetical protein